MSYSIHYLRNGGKNNHGFGLVAFFSVLDTINKSLLGNKWSGVFEILPFYIEGIGWIIPALIGLLVGYLIGMLKSHSSVIRTKP